jgi:hypothetical protein
MDEKTRQKIRGSATRIHWIMQGLIVLAVVIGVFLYALNPGRIFAKLYSDQRLSKTSMLVWNEVVRFSSGRGERLIAFPPPDASGKRVEWAASITEEFRQPAAVFIKNGPQITWVSVPPEFVPGAAHMERYLRGAKTKEDHDGLRRRGAYQILHVSFEGDSLSFMGWMVGRADDSLRWGAVVRWWDSYRAFYSLLDDPMQQAITSSPACALKEVIRLPGGWSSGELPAHRATLNGEVLFESPKLDTTRHVYVFEHQGSNGERFKEEFFESKRDAKYASFMSRPWITWRSFVVPILVMLVLYINFHWIRRLTEPVAPPS